jgi:transcriptional regulator with XRE-family HTH domain
MNTKKSKSASDIFKKVLGHVSFGEMIHSLRLTEEITQKAFAKKLGISTSELCDIEKGRKFISIQRATKFAKKLNDSPEVFIQYIIQDEILRAGLKCVIKILPNKSAA